MTDKKTEKKPEEKKGAKKDSGKVFYNVLQTLSFNGGVHKPSYKAGGKTIPADIVEMTEAEASAFGKKYLKKIDKK